MYTNMVPLGNSALLCYYAGSSRNFLPTFRDNPSVLFYSLNPKDGIDGMYRDVDKKLPLFAE